MAPKKKGGKKAQDDWENEIGESVEAPTEAPSKPTEENGTANGEEEEMGGGGLLASIRKNRARKAKKGKVVEDFVEGEDPSQEDGGNTPAPVDLASKAPVEANAEDEDVFGQPTKKGKGGKAQSKEKEPENEDDGEGGHLKTKKEKEKEKKEREKQRKKEQVCQIHLILGLY
jgi:translation initiation factor 5B